MKILRDGEFVDVEISLNSDLRVELIPKCEPSSELNLINENSIAEQIESGGMREAVDG